MFASPQLVNFLSEGFMVPGKTWYGIGICKSQANGPLTGSQERLVHLSRSSLRRGWCQAQGEVLPGPQGAVGGAGRVSVVGLPTSEKEPPRHGVVLCVLSLHLFKLVQSCQSPNLY